MNDLAGKHERARTTLIVKQTKDFERADADGDTRLRLFRDAACIAFLTRTSGDGHRYAPFLDHPGRRSVSD